MERQYKDSASREQSQACLNSAEAQPVFERKFKDSGIEWIGKIPETWEVKRLKNLCTSQGSLIADGDWIESPDISDSGIRYYTTGNIGDGTFKKQGKSFVTEETFQRLNCTPVFPGDFPYIRRNPSPFVRFAQLSSLPSFVLYASAALRIYRVDE